MSRRTNGGGGRFGSAGRGRSWRGSMTLTVLEWKAHPVGGALPGGFIGGSFTADATCSQSGRIAKSAKQQRSRRPTSELRSGGQRSG